MCVDQGSGSRITDLIIDATSELQRRVAMRRDHSMLAHPPAPRSWCHSRAASSAWSVDVNCQPPRSSAAPRSFASLHAIDAGKVGIGLMERPL